MIAVSVCQSYLSVCTSVCQTVCHEAQLGFTVHVSFGAASAKSLWSLVTMIVSANILCDVPEAVTLAGRLCGSLITIIEPQVVVWCCEGCNSDFSSWFEISVSLTTTFFCILIGRGHAAISYMYMADWIVGSIVQNVLLIVEHYTSFSCRPISIAIFVCYCFTHQESKRIQYGMRKHNQTCMNWDYKVTKWR